MNCKELHVEELERCESLKDREALSDRPLHRPPASNSV